jgi:sugar-specific transcriptional regulator TrmB
MLERFGFSPTESKVYQSLLSLGPTTGYAVALEVGIARANVYQALEALTRQGAARKSATVPVHYAATGPSALLAELERSFRYDLTALENDLRSLPIGGTGQAELELLTSADHLLVRAASCVDAATAELFVVTGPWASPVHDRFGSAAARRVQIRAVALGDPAPEGAILRPVPEGELRAYWGGLPIAVVADRGRAVFGVLLEGRAASGVATSAPGAVPFLRHLLRREFGG